MIIAGLWRYGDWRHVATGCNALVVIMPQFWPSVKLIRSQTGQIHHHFAPAAVTVPITSKVLAKFLLGRDGVVENGSRTTNRGLDLEEAWPWPWPQRPLALALMWWWPLPHAVTQLYRYFSQCSNESIHYKFIVKQLCEFELWSAWIYYDTEVMLTSALASK